MRCWPDSICGCWPSRTELIHRLCRHARFLAVDRPDLAARHDHRFLPPETARNGSSARFAVGHGRLDGRRLAGRFLVRRSEWLCDGSAAAAGPDGRLDGRTCFTSPVCCLCVVGVYCLTLPHTPPQPARDSKPAPLAALQLLRGRAFFVYTICLFGVCVTYPFSTQGTPLLLAKLGVCTAWMPPTLTIAQITEVISSRPSADAAASTERSRHDADGSGGVDGALPPQAIGRPVELVAGSLCFNGVCIAGFFVAGQVFVNSRVHDGLRASVQALLTFVNGLGMLLGNLLFGWLRIARAATAASVRRRRDPHGVC